jgi:hypothetical protein
MAAAYRGKAGRGEGGVQGTGGGALVTRTGTGHTGEGGGGVGQV